MSLRLASFLTRGRALGPVGLLALLALALAGCTPQIGKSCSLSTDCSQLGDRLCDTSQPGGYCTIFNCEPDTCPSSSCVAFDPLLDPACGAAADGRWPRFERSFCLADCNSDSDCRAQYDCVDLSIQSNQILRRAEIVDQLAGASTGNGYKVCMAATCGDGIQDGTETDVDCGGSACYACGNGLRCGSASDCASGICINGLCLGSQTCVNDADCSTGLCNNADPVSGCPAATACTCAGTNCNNQRWDGQVTNGDEVNTDGHETDVDCGGPDCPRCVSTATKLFHCAVYTDCASNLCFQEGTTSVCPADASTACSCSPGDCRDQKQDGAETDVDCGGGSLVNGVAIGCPGCLFQQKCGVDSDCASSTCVAGKCAAPPICSVPDAGPAWTSYNPDAGTGGAGTGGAGTGGTGPVDAGSG